LYGVRTAVSVTGCVTVEAVALRLNVVDRRLAVNVVVELLEL
jgi:hypothetical protein